MTNERAIEISQRGTLDFVVGSLVREGVVLKDSHIGWEGEVRLELPVDEDPLIKTDGKLTSKALSADFPVIEVGVKHQGVAWRGAVSIDAGDVERSIQAKGALLLSELEVVDHKESVNPLALQHFALEEVLVEGLDEIGLGQINVQQLSVLSSKLPPVLSLRDIAVHQVKFKQKNDVAVDSIVFNGLDANITVLENGELDVIHAYIETVKIRLDAVS